MDPKEVQRVKLTHRADWDDSFFALVLVVIVWWCSCAIVTELKGIREALTASQAVEQEVE